MRLPKNVLSGTYTKPRIFLCETDKSVICQLETTNTEGVFKFNTYSELSFDVSRTFNNLNAGATGVNPFYDKIEALRIIYLEGIGCFQLQGPKLNNDGIKEYKQCTAYSLEYILSQYYLEDFYINTGKVESLEVIYAEEAKKKIAPIQLYNEKNHKLSLLHLALEKAYGWKIGHIDASLKKLTRSFEITRQSIYDFLMNEVCEKFNCYIVFDTINNEINIYAESSVSRFTGNGKKKRFVISPPYAEIDNVSIDGYKTISYSYNPTNGYLTMDEIPEKGAKIEVVDGSLTEWLTDVFISFDNLSQEVEVDYDADNIKTVLSVTYGENGNIRETNLGLPYITDLSYYCTVDWMGQDLYDRYMEYQDDCEGYRETYLDNSERILEIYKQISYEENRLSLKYSEASVSEETVGTYYIRGGSAPDYYYTEVSLPADYKTDTQYYSMNTVNLTEEKVSDLYSALKKYFNDENKDDNTGDNPITSWKTDMLALADSFSFMIDNTIASLCDSLSKIKSNRTKSSDAKDAIKLFLNEMWNEVGVVPLESLYLKTYKTVQSVNVSDGWSNKKHKSYGYYYPVVIFIEFLNSEVKERNEIIKQLEDEVTTLQTGNLEISKNISMTEYFTEGQLMRLSAFLREDELHIEDIVETDQDTIADTFKVKQDAMATGRIELRKLCQPQLNFSMSMANIYALPEFEPIVDQFQLGKVIKVALREDYVKQSRLLQVKMNLDDLSNFSCEFGELTSLKTQSDIHADLLSQAVTAGKSVATNASYWSKGSDQATMTDIKIKNGLLDAATAIKSIDGTQDVSIDQYGIHLRKKIEGTDEYDDKQGWIVNNQFLYSDDGFNSTKSVFGEYVVDGQSYWGLLAEAVIAGYIEGSTIVGTSINIGDGAFKVDGTSGAVTMGGDKVTHTIKGYATTKTVEAIENKVVQINDSKMYRIEVITNGSTVISTDKDSTQLNCNVYSWDADITDDIDASNFKWRRSSSNAELDAVWNNSSDHQNKKSITITAKDIIENSSFMCVVELPD